MEGRQYVPLPGQQWVPEGSFPRGVGAGEDGMGCKERAWKESVEMKYHSKYSVLYREVLPGG